MQTSRLAVTANTRGGASRRAFMSRELAGNPVSGNVWSRPLRFAALLAAAAFPGTAMALTLGWNPNPETDIAGYRLKYGTSPGSHPHIVDAGLNTSASITGLQEGATYYFVVSATNRAGLQSPDSAEIIHQIPAAPPTSGGQTQVIPRDGWALQYVSSQETHGENGAATNAFDGNPATFWHSEWDLNAPPPPHEIRIDLGRAWPLRGFRYLPRQDGTPHGNIGQYEFYVSSDGVNWGSPVASGTFPNSSVEKEVLFAEKTGRYIRLRTLTDASGEFFCSIAELNILAGPATPPPNSAPVADDIALATVQDIPAGVVLAASDAEGDALTYSIVAGPAHGTLSGNPPSLIYTPAAGFSGSDSFTFRANDGQAFSNTATVSITVTAIVAPPPPPVVINHPPVFVASPFSLHDGSENSPYSATLVGSASDPDQGDSITYQKVAGPAWLALSPDGSLSGTPPAGSAGLNRFTISATDSMGATAEALLDIRIGTVDLPPPWVITVLGSGSGSQAAMEGGDFRLDGAGLLGGTADSGGFVSQPLSGDGEIIVRVMSQTHSLKSAAAGVMIRDSLAANAMQVFAGLDGTGRWYFAKRGRTGRANRISTSSITGRTPDAWLRLVRKGGTVSAYCSANGSRWKRFGSTTTNIGSQCHFGMFQASGGAASGSAIFNVMRANP